MSRVDGFAIQQVGRVEEIGQPIWDALSKDSPFASYRWMRFGQTVMSDCETTYLILRIDNQLAARAAFWRVSAEPLPLPPLVRAPIAAYLRKRPLLICRAPLAGWTGMILPAESSLRSAACRIFEREGLRLLAEERGSFLAFDFLDASNWLGDAPVVTVPDPGTRMQIRWKTFDEYVASLSGHDRKNYKRTLREAEKRRLVRSVHSSITDLDASLALIRRMEKKFSSAPNPWVKPLLEHAHEIGGVWQEVRQDGRLVGCGLLLDDNNFMFATALGLEEGVQYAYFLLVYGCVQIAIEKQARVLRLGSGAYDVKRRLGCELETNNYTAVAANNPLLRYAAKWMS